MSTNELCEVFQRRLDKLIDGFGELIALEKPLKPLEKNAKNNSTEICKAAVKQFKETEVIEGCIAKSAELRFAELVATGSMSSGGDKKPEAPPNVKDEKLTIADLFAELGLAKDATTTNEEDIFKYLPEYFPSAAIKAAHGAQFSTAFLKKTITNAEFRAYLNTPKLTANNINEVLEHLLQMEDIILMDQYPALARKNLQLHKGSKAEVFYIEVLDLPLNFEGIVQLDLDEVVLVPKQSAIATTLPLAHAIDSLLPHLHEHLEFEDELYRCVGFIQKVEGKQVHINFSKTVAKSLHLKFKLQNQNKYDIIFRPHRLFTRFQFRALELLSINVGLRKYLFPKSHTTSVQQTRQAQPIKDMRAAIIDLDQELELVNPTIKNNPEQLQAVQNIVGVGNKSANTYAPYVVFGPPGTGKTTAIVESIIQLCLRKPGSRILVTTGSNSASDTLALRILEYCNSNSRVKQINRAPGLFVRVYSMSIEKKGTINKDLRPYSNYKDGEYSKFKLREILDYSIVVATLCSVGSMSARFKGAFNIFTHIFIDEAAATTEPESLVAIAGIKRRCSHLILSGDHKQLGPVLLSKRASELGLQQSLMERLLLSDAYRVAADGSYNTALQTRLRRNYRSHPQIVRLYNLLYYNNELLAMAPPEDVNSCTKWSILPNAEFPIIFQAAHGVFTKAENSPSSYNDLEVGVLLWFLDRLLRDGINGTRVHQTDIGIITPYKAQAALIQRRLRARSRNWRDIQTGPVETFQGCEKPIIIVSLVRSFRGMGFLRNPRRLNVLLSRAKSLLILIGNPLTLRQNADFKFILDECQRNGTFMRKAKQRKQHK